MVNDPTDASRDGRVADISTIRTVRNYLRFAVRLGYWAIVLGFLVAIVWYLPYLALACALACAVVVAAVAPPMILYERVLKWFKRSPGRVWRWERTLIIIGRIFKPVFHVALILAVLGAIYLWYPFEPIGDIPLARLTLNQIVVNLLGVFLLVGAVVVLASATRDAFRYDYGDWDFYESGRFVALLVLVLIGLSIVYWLAPAFVEEVFSKWRSDFHRWWSSVWAQ